jgi:hypothetical protein
MKREIKFRGQRIDNDEWVYGYYVKDPKGNHRIYYKPFEEASSNTYHFVKPETVGQFIGLYDSFNNEVYDNDVLISSYSRDMSGRDIVNTEQVIEYEIKPHSGEAGYEILFPERSKVIGQHLS